MGHEKYQISIERDGRMVPVGSISGESYRAANQISNKPVELLFDRDDIYFTVSY